MQDFPALNTEKQVFWYEHMIPTYYVSIVV